MAQTGHARQARGERRRRAILDAALRLISEGGVEAVTHRAVAEEAGVPASATTYYFDSLDELLECSLQLFVDEEIARLSELTERLDGLDVPPRERARLFRAELRSEVSRSQLELYLEAARRPGLRDTARRSIEAYTAAAAAALRAAGVSDSAIEPRAFVALFDGYGLHGAAGADDQGLEDALMALWAAATRAIGTRNGEQLT